MVGPEPGALPRTKDLASGVVCIVASALATAGFAVLAARTASRDAWPGRAGYIVAVSIYGACLIFRFVMGALSAFTDRRGALLALEEAGTFFLPAGMLMPVAFSYFHGVTRWLTFSLAWAYAFGGFVLHLALVGWFRRYAVSLGYAFFFVVLPALPGVRPALGAEAFGWVFAGGGMFLVALLFAGKDGFPYAHALWHAFSFGGVALSYVSLTLFLA